MWRRPHRLGIYECDTGADPERWCRSATVGFMTWLRSAIRWLWSLVGEKDDAARAIDQQRSAAIRRDPRTAQDMSSRGGGLI